MQTNARSLQDPGGEGWGRWCHSQTPLCFLLRGRGVPRGQVTHCQPSDTSASLPPQSVLPRLPHPHNFCQPATCVAPVGGRKTLRAISLHFSSMFPLARILYPLPLKASTNIPFSYSWPA